MPGPTAQHRRSVGVAVLIGVGVMAAVDEIVFHQILAWHHFYDRSTHDIALLSDGLLHAAELVILVAGGVMLVDLARRGTLSTGSAWGGFFLGSGGFQIFDGLVNHKVLRLHQVRDVENLLPYDIAWNAAGVVLVLIGVSVIARTGRTMSAQAERSGR